MDELHPNKRELRYVFTNHWFFPEPNPDDSLKFKVVLQGPLETSALEIMGWQTLEEAGPWENELTQAQNELFSELLGTPDIKELALFIGLSGSFKHLE